MSLLVALTLFVMAQGPGPARPPAAGSGPATAPTPADLVTALESAIADAIARVEPSVVAIHRHKGENSDETKAVRGRNRRAVNEIRDRFELPIRQDQEDFISLDYGSGVVIGGAGEILTAFHVVRGADRLRVHAAGGQSFEAEVIAADPRSDLAVIAPVEGRDAERPRLRPLAIGDSTRLRKGSFLVVLGNHYNAAREDGSASASWGILSNFARRLDLENELYGLQTRQPSLQNYPTLLQLDAKLNLGMSGGAVVNLKGEFVGLTTTAASPAGFDAQAGYAIPMDRLGRRIVETLKQGKEVEYGLLGIKANNMKTTLVTDVTRNSPASRGLLQVGDEILAVNGTPISTFDELILTVGVFPPGDPVQLKIRRSNEVIERTVVLAKYPLKGEVIATNRPKPWRGVRVEYTSTLDNWINGPIEPDTMSTGVIAVDVDPGSLAAAAGLKKGVIILRVGEKPVQSPRAFAEAVEGLEGPVTLVTNMGVVTVGTADSPAPKQKPAESRPPGR